MLTRRGLQIPACDALGNLAQLLRRSRGHDLAARLAAPRAHVDEVVRVADYVQVMFNNHYRGALVQEVLEHAQ